MRSALRAFGSCAIAATAKPQTLNLKRSISNAQLQTKSQAQPQQRKNPRQLGIRPARSPRSPPSKHAQKNTLKPPKNYPLLPETTDRSGLAGYQLETQLPGIAKALTAPSSDVTLFEEGGLT